MQGIIWKSFIRGFLLRHMHLATRCTLYGALKGPKLSHFCPAQKFILLLNSEYQNLQLAILTYLFLSCNSEYAGYHLDKRDAGKHMHQLPTDDNLGP